MFAELSPLLPYQLKSGARPIAILAQVGTMVVSAKRKRIQVLPATLQVKAKGCDMKRTMLLLVAFSVLAVVVAIAEMTRGLSVPNMYYRGPTDIVGVSYSECVHHPIHLSSSKQPRSEQPLTEQELTNQPQTDQLHEERHSDTLSYSLWAKNVSCLACLANSPRNVKAMTRTEFLCCLKSMRDAMPTGLTQQDYLALKEARFSLSFIRTLPKRDLPRFGSCAVVASASSLKKYQYGNEIDSHDAVFRFNDAPTEGFETFVGRKSTVRVINSQLPYYYSSTKSTLFSSLLSQADNNTIIFERDEVPPAATGEGKTAKRQSNASTVWNNSKWNTIDKYLTLRQKFPNISYYLIHPVFALFSMKRLLQYHTGMDSLNEASSGFVGVILATLLCDNVTSYEVATDDPYSSTVPYYYSKHRQNYRKNWHPLGHERELIRKMGECRQGQTVCKINIDDCW